MRTAICSGIVVVVAAVAGSLMACGKSPSQPEVVQKSPPQTAPPVTTGIRVSGPATLAPGATGQFTAIAQRSDGSSEDITTSATWWSNRNWDVLQVSSAGTAQALARGESIVSATSGAFTTFVRSNSLTVLVLEPGTFRVSGTVTETGGPMSQAAIEIVSGTGTGLRTTSDFAGHYALYGAAGDVQLRASGDGLEQQVHRLVVTDNAADNFDLRPLATPTDVSGSWILTLSAAASCRANLPEVARAREFDARITQQSTHLYVTLTSPTIYDFNAPSYDGDGRIFGQALSFLIWGDTGYGDWNYPDVFDRLSPTQWLGISGLAQGTVRGSEIRATLDTTMGGNFDYWESLPTAPFPGGQPLAVCHAKDNGMLFRRR